jgi:hypothetical protein
MLMIFDDDVIGDEHQQRMKKDYYLIPHKLFRDEQEEAEVEVEVEVEE